jgi:hypothetical protein
MMAKSKKISFRGWRDRENLPEKFKTGDMSDCTRVRDVFVLLRSCGLIFVACPWCFFQKVRGKVATCPICDTVVHADGRRTVSLPLVDDQPVVPGKVSRKIGERMLSEGFKKIEALAASDMLEDAWTRTVRPGKKFVN